MKDFDEFHSWIEFEKRYLNEGSPVAGFLAIRAG